MQCRASCGACCIAPSINSPIPGMPNGKPAGVRCVQLNDDNLCKIFGKPERPAFCGSLQPSLEMCGGESLGHKTSAQAREYAMTWLRQLEKLTRPS